MLRWIITGFIVGVFGLWLCWNVWQTDKLAVVYLAPMFVLCVSFCWARVMDILGALQNVNQQ